MNKLDNILLVSLDVINSIDELVNIQCSDGNWNVDPYMHGMANGMILVQSIISGKPPEFLDAPKKWLSKKVI